MHQRLKQILCAATLVSLAIRATSAQNANSQYQLANGWRVQSSAKISAIGDSISTPRFKTTGWYSTSVPTTVLAALVANRVYPDPYVGMNLRSIPGTWYPVGRNF